jgi:hypothetical protein
MIIEGQALMTCSPNDLATLMKWPVKECLLEGMRMEESAELSKAAHSKSCELQPTRTVQHLGIGAAQLISSMELHESIAADLLWESYPGDYQGFVSAIYELETKGCIARNATGALVRIR